MGKEKSHTGEEVNRKIYIMSVLFAAIGSMILVYFSLFGQRVSLSVALPDSFRGVVDGIYCVSLSADEFNEVQRVIGEAKLEKSRWINLYSLSRAMAKENDRIKFKDGVVSARVEVGSYFIFYMGKGYGYYGLLNVKGDIATELDESWLISGI